MLLNFDFKKFLTPDVESSVTTLHSYTFSRVGDISACSFLEVSDIMAKIGTLVYEQQCSRFYSKLSSPLLMLYFLSRSRGRRTSRDFQRGSTLNCVLEETEGFKQFP